MKYLKLFEELNRITVTAEEKSKLKEITRFFISILKDKKLTSGIKEKKFLEYDLDSLRSLLKPDDYTTMQHRNDGYKKVDAIAKDLSRVRGTNVIFDRKDNCFKTSSGKAMCTFYFPSKDSEYKVASGGAFLKEKTTVFINYKTGDYFNDRIKNSQKLKTDENGHIVTKDPSYIRIWDFTGPLIVVPVDDNRKIVENGLYADMFSVIYHEFIHAKDPQCWQGLKDYGKATDAAPNLRYGSHDAEIQTMFNNLLELVAYYFERTWRGDTDGGGLNYNLTKEHLLKNFFPTLLEVKDFIRNKRRVLSDNAMKQLSGTNKNIRFIKTACKYMNEAKDEAQDKMKFVYQWMEHDFVKLAETFNKKITEINKKKPKGQELPLMNITK